MAQRPSWNSVYEGSPPWDIGRPQPDFVMLADAGKFRGRVLDVGCGTGEHVMLAASHGAEAMGVDMAGLAIARGWAKACPRGISTRLKVLDVLSLHRLRVGWVTGLDAWGRELNGHSPPKSIITRTNRKPAVPVRYT